MASKIRGVRRALLASLAAGTVAAALFTSPGTAAADPSPPIAYRQLAQLSAQPIVTPGRVPRVDGRAVKRLPRPAGRKSRIAKTMAPAGRAALPPDPGGDTRYTYARGFQQFTSAPYPTMLWASTKIFSSYLDSSDYHTLAELAVINGPVKTGQIIEVGYTIDPSTNGDTAPHLFSYWWKNGRSICYNGCGFVDYAAGNKLPVRVGMRVNPGATATFGIQYDPGSNGWWLSGAVSDVNGGAANWLGYYPGTLWSETNVYGTATTTPTYGTDMRAFDEVAAGNVTPAGAPWPTCSDMGGVRPDQWSTTADTHYWAGVTYGTSTTPVMTWETAGPDAGGYGVLPVTSNAAWLGGEGYNPGGQLPGHPGWC